MPSELRVSLHVPSQVPHEGQFLSCCAAVHGSARNLFVVPRPEVLEPHRENILTAVQEAAADPSAQGHLMQTLHVRPILENLLLNCQGLHLCINVAYHCMRRQ